MMEFGSKFIVSISFKLEISVNNCSFNNSA